MPDFGRWTSNGGDPSLNEINRTDRFLDALATEQPVYSTDPGEAELANLFAGWRDEVRTPALTAPVTPRDAVVALDRAVASRRRTRSMALVGSVAATVLALGGFVSVVAGAGPGDALYGLHTMFFGEQQSQRNDAVMLASQQLAEVQQLIDDGQWEAAQDKLQTLTTTVASVNDVEAKEDLVTQWQELTVKVERQDANATVAPGAPAPVFPDVPAVVAPGTDTSTLSEAATTSPSETTTSSPSDTTTSSPTSSPVQQPPPTSIPVTTPPPTTQTPLPTPPPTTPLPTPQPTTPLPTPTAVTPLPTPTTRITLPTPLPDVSGVVEEPSAVAGEEAPTSEEQPVLEAPAPKTVVTTTIVVPDGDKPR
jgi:Anti-sigma-D factor RsdA to sigma factor binding region